MHTPPSSRMLNYRYWRLMANRGVRWVSDRISQRNYQILVSIVIGIVAGVAAVLIKISIHELRELLFGKKITGGQWAFVFLPTLGVLFTLFFVRRILKKQLVSGLSGLIHSISQKKVNLPRYETYAHAIASSLTVGFGGSVGLEAPIVRTGSAIGANLAGMLRVGRNKQTLFLACGAAGGMAAIFNSPVAGVIFAFEVLLTDIALSSFIPLLISAATGAVISRLFYFEQIFFFSTEGWKASGIPFYVILGILCGLTSAYMIRMIIYFGKLVSKIQGTFVKIALGGLALGLLIFLMPPLFGEGYQSVNDLLAGRFYSLADHSPFFRVADETWFILLFGTALVLTKAMASSITLAIGGNGGTFAPSMFTGAMLGFVFSHTVNHMGLVYLNEPNFIAVGMAGVLSGVFKSPLTGIFLIAEITGGYALFVPLMIVSALSYFTSHYFEPQSIFTRDLFQKGLWAPPHERDLNILKNLELKPLIETNFSILSPDMTLGKFVEVISKSKRNVFPVVNDQGLFKGIVLLDDVREIMFDQEKYEEITIRELMHNPPALVDIADSMEHIMHLFDYHKAWNLPVADQGMYLGFVSKSSVFNQYRQRLIDSGKEA